MPILFTLFAHILLSNLGKVCGKKIRFLAKLLQNILSQPAKYLPRKTLKVENLSFPILKFALLYYFSSFFGIPVLKITQILGLNVRS